MLPGRSAKQATWMDAAKEFVQATPTSYVWPVFRPCTRYFVAARRILSHLTLGMLKARHILIFRFDSVAGPGSCQMSTS